MLIAGVSPIWTKLADGGGFVAGIGAIAVILGVLFARRQLNIQAKNTRFLVYDSLTRLVMDTDRVFIEYPAMRKYFYEAVPPPTDPVELARAQAIAELLADFMDHVAEHITSIDHSAWQQWRAYFRELMEGEVMRDFMSDKQAWYCKRLWNEVVDKDYSPQ